MNVPLSEKQQHCVGNLTTQQTVLKLCFTVAEYAFTICEKCQLFYVYDKVLTVIVSSICKEVVKQLLIASALKGSEGVFKRDILAQLRKHTQSHTDEMIVYHYCHCIPPLIFDIQMRRPLKRVDLQDAGHEMTQFETAICPSFISLPSPYTSPIQYPTLCNVPFHTLHRSVMPR